MPLVSRAILLPFLRGRCVPCEDSLFLPPPVRPRFFYSSFPSLGKEACASPWFDVNGAPSGPFVSASRSEADRPPSPLSKPSRPSADSPVPLVPEKQSLPPSPDRTEAINSGGGVSFLPFFPPWGATLRSAFFGFLRLQFVNTPALYARSPF